MKKASPKFTWQLLAKDKAQFQSFLSLMRAEKVKSIEVDGIKVEFQEAKYIQEVPAGKLQVDRLPELTEEQKQKEFDDILFHSAG